MDTTTKDIRTRALERLIARRNRLQEAYDALVGEPQSYGITGSVSATNVKMTELRREISAIDDKIAALVGRGGVAGMEIRIPDYHCPWMRMTETVY